MAAGRLTRCQSHRERDSTADWASRRTRAATLTASAKPPVFTSASTRGATAPSAASNALRHVAFSPATSFGMPAEAAPYTPRPRRRGQNRYGSVPATSASRGARRSRSETTSSTSGQAMPTSGSSKAICASVAGS